MIFYSSLFMLFQSAALIIVIMCDSGEKPIIETTGTIKSFQNLFLFARYWHISKLPRKETKALVFISHGVTEHSGVYDFIGKAIANEKFFVFAHDHVGHGKSEGDRVHIDDFNTYIEDVMLHLKEVRDIHEMYQDLPFYIVGHSMGGTIAIKTAIDKRPQVNGLVLIGPAILLNVNQVIKAIGGTVISSLTVLARIAAAFSPQSGLVPADTSFISRNTTWVKMVEEDPLIYHGNLKAKWCVQMYNMMEEIRSKLSFIDIPFLIIHGTEDKICDLKGSELMMTESKSNEKSLKIFKGAYHQVHREINGMSERCVSMIVQWLDATYSNPIRILS